MTGLASAFFIGKTFTGTPSAAAIRPQHSFGNSRSPCSTISLSRTPSSSVNRASVGCDRVRTVVRRLLQVQMLPVGSVIPEPSGKPGSQQQDRVAGLRVDLDGDGLQRRQSGPAIGCPCESRPRQSAARGRGTRAPGWPGRTPPSTPRACTHDCRRQRVGEADEHRGDVQHIEPDPNHVSRDVGGGPRAPAPPSATATAVRTATCGVGAGRGRPGGRRRDTMVVAVPEGVLAAHAAASAPAPIGSPPARTRDIRHAVRQRGQAGQGPGGNSGRAAISKSSAPGTPATARHTRREEER